MKLYDGAFSGGAHHGTLLSSASFTSNVTEGAANVSVPLILAGVLASYKVVVTQQPAMYDTTSVGTAVLDAYDPDGNLIIGSGTFTLSNGSAESIGLTTIPNGKLTFSVNGGAYAPSVSIANPGDAITFKQAADIIGAQILASVPTLFPITAAWVRPTGLSSQFVEGSVISSSGTNQIAPFVDASEGVAVVAENAPGGGIFATNGNSVANAQCNLPIAPAADFAYEGGVAWMPAYSTDGTNPRLFTIAGSGTCSGGPQFVADTAIGISGVGVEFVNYDGVATCVPGTMVPGVYQNLDSAIANCSSPHDLVVTANRAGYTALETDTSDNDDHVLGFYGTTLIFNTLISFGGTTAAGGTLTSEAMRSDNNVYMHQVANNRLWSMSWSTYAINGFVALPSSYTYVNHHNVLYGHSYSTRTIAIGSDGLAYIAISSPVNGLLVVDPDTGAAVNLLPNVSGASSSTVQQVVADGRGSIYLECRRLPHALSERVTVMRVHPWSVIPGALVAAAALTIAGCGGGSSSHSSRGARTGDDGREDNGEGRRYVYADDSESHGNDGAQIAAICFIIRAVRRDYRKPGESFRPRSISASAARSAPRPQAAAHARFPQSHRSAATRSSSCSTMVRSMRVVTAAPRFQAARPSPRRSRRVLPTRRCRSCSAASSITRRRRSFSRRRINSRAPAAKSS